MADKKQSTVLHASRTTLSSAPWRTAFEERSDLQEYGDNALGLFALALRFGLDDLVSVAADSITDGSDDKKCDIIYLNEEDSRVIVAQCYYSQRDKISAPSNKASDLNTAVAWLLQRPLEDLPEQIRSSASALRDGIRTKTISNLDIWYIHNLPESKNVSDELLTVEHAANSALKSVFPNVNVMVNALEVGKNKLEEWYSHAMSPILVNDELEVEIVGGFEVKGPEWKAYVSTIPARFLYSIYKKHRTKLFSANVRDYLGSKNSDSNINNGIKKTIEDEPTNFGVYNNGLTILVNSYELPIINGRKQILKVKGMSIVNGAQTTGAIGNLGKSPAADAIVPVRFVQTQNNYILQNIIQFNNSQNKVTASDFRSTDKIQKRLKDEISKIPSADYEGGRRGGYGDAIQRRPNLLPSYTVGQAMAAMHGDPSIAYNQKSGIWINDSVYAKYFNEKTTGVHIVFAYGLFRAVENHKMQLIAKANKGETLTNVEDGQLKFFRTRGSHYLFMSAIAGSLETFISRLVPNLFRVSFGAQVTPKQAQENWEVIVTVTSPFVTQLSGISNAKKDIELFRSLIDSTKEYNEEKYNNFRKKIIVKSV